MQPRLGYHASHEQFSPGALLGYLKAAQQAGFDCGMCSDHFHPWGEAQGQSGFAWSWLGAALQATDLPLGVVNAPAFRYHPALIAQAAATLAQMYPGRFWLAVGSGEAINEAILGQRWPDKAERNARLLEAVQLIRALWAGEQVTHHGLLQLVRARLYTLPAQPPALFAAALSPQTARWAGAWADGLITVSAHTETLRAIVEAFREGGGEGKPLYLQVKLSYAATDEAALAGAHVQWRTNVFAAELAEDVASPAAFDAMARYVTPADVARHVRVSSDPARHAHWLQQDLALGFDALLLHNVNGEQARFIETFGAKVLPQLRQAGANSPPTRNQ
ncbi:TIGR03885 family FMN-dependent LLM class oxidoreductase [Chitiniphilus purpureus]|uniref:TIGR03885 family FMN-dependent LLM class oxidoreductase n=1 Tax=Chitiniphilus purpureus TaxID=2981137 RepID=A0ABY6DPJ4_9NEIS|nr:TIGR03885 family FMN-dependent LLM class oxidoreductase [Chitiniphilus sp. CD1]UXY16289.1 TIGR03885 family FMN-dependent LLM class oxidoreductase [Chitiniphilus sp. CD1]